MARDSKGRFANFQIGGNKGVGATQAARLGGGGPQGFGKVVPLTYSGMAPVTIDASQLISMIDWIFSLDGILNDPAIIVPAIRIMGSTYHRNFESGGTKLGHRWQALSPYTLRVREERHFGPGPILVQSGALRLMAAERFETWRAIGRQSQSMNDSGLTKYANDGVTSMTASVTPKLFTATMSGPKVNHMVKQYLITRLPINPTTQEAWEAPGRYGQGFLPTRPFWGFNKGLGMFMTEEVANGIMGDWGSSVGGIGSGYFRTRTMTGKRVR